MRKTVLLLILTLAGANTTDLRAVEQGASQQARSQEPASLTLSRDLRIDGDSADLVQPGWLLPTRDGGVMISQRTDGRVLRFDANGKLSGQFGRLGQGPGEFQMVGPAGSIGDSIWVVDAQQQRGYVVSPNMTLVRVFEYPAPHPALGQENRFPAYGTSLLRAIYGDGSMLVLPSIMQGAPPASFDTSGSHLFRVASDGSIRQLVSRFPDAAFRSVCMSSGRGGGRCIAVPFAAQNITTVSRSGDRIAHLSLVYDGPLANTMRLVVLSAGGDTVVSRNIPFMAERIPQGAANQAKADAVARGRTAGARGSSDPAFAVHIEATMKIPPVYPPYSGMLLAEDGSIWIRQRRKVGETQDSYMILDRRGNTTGVTKAPANVTINAITATHAWAVELDSNDVPSIVRFRLDR